MKKQLQLLTSAILMALAGLSTYGQEVREVGEEFAIDGIRYKIHHTINSSSLSNPSFYLPGVLRIVGYTGTTKEVAIPAKVFYQGGDYWVTDIGNNAFEAKGLIGVDIPWTVTNIGNNAFLDNQLTDVAIPFRVNNIGASAFQNNQNLNTVIVRRSSPQRSVQMPLIIQALIKTS